MDVHFRDFGLLHFVVANGAKHRISVSGHEGNCRLLPALGADDVGHLPIGKSKLCLARRATLGTACGYIDKLLFLVELLLTSGPRKRTAAFSTGERLVLEKHVPDPSAWPRALVSL